VAEAEPASLPARSKVAAAPAGPAAALTLEMARPYFTAGAAAEGLALRALESWAPARAKLESAVAGADDGAAARLRLLIAVTDFELERWQRAGEGLVRAATELPLLADYANFHAARAFYRAGRAGRAEAAMTHARKVSKGSIHRMDAELLIGDVLQAGRDRAQVVAHYRRYLADYPDGIRLAEARFRLAEALAASGQEPGEVVSLLKKVMVADPLTHWAKRAEEKLPGAVARLPRASRGAAAALTAAELIERGIVYYGEMRNELSEADFAAALKAPGLDAESRCVAAYHLANSIFKQRDRNRAAPLFDAAMAACDKSANVDLQVKAAYQAGRSYGMTARSEIAIERYAKVEKQHPEHTYADDARLRQAEQHRELGNQDKVTELLSSMPTRYPDGDMRAEAMWRLAWRAFKAKSYREALGWLEKQVKTKPLDDNYWAEGQAQYWMGRSHAALGDKRKALAAYERAVTTYPMGYYALLSLNRIREMDAGRFAAITRAIAEPPAGHDPDSPAMRFQPRAEYSSDDFARALEFLRLGLGSEAQRELSALGFKVPPGKDEVTDPDQRDRIWAMAFLYHQAGRYPHSHWVTRWHVLDFKRHWPVGHHRLRWRIAYPTAWWSLLDKHATKHGFPTELLISFVREESAFDPLRESFANAIGLTQMIRPTARRFARGTGIAVSRATLRDPVKNVTIGSRFLDMLYRRFEGRVALVVPSYNAGEGATDRWLRERGDWAMDEWAEEIPYDETRRYSKRVLGTFFAYSYLKNKTIPVMPNDIPPAAVTRAKR
jgi:soluble lytic murein transglycosylase